MVYILLLFCVRSWQSLLLLNSSFNISELVYNPVQYKHTSTITIYVTVTCLETSQGDRPTQVLAAGCGSPPPPPPWITLAIKPSHIIIIIMLEWICVWMCSPCSRFPALGRSHLHHQCHRRCSHLCCCSVRRDTRTKTNEWTNSTIIILSRLIN